MARSKKSSGADDVPRSPFAERGFVLSAGFLGIAMIIGLLTILTGSDDSGTGSAAVSASPVGTLPALPPATPCPTPSPAVPQASASTTAGKAGTANAGAAATQPPAAPPATSQAPTAVVDDVVWTYYFGLALPSSDTAGPLAAEGDTARCFEHSRTGALLAAVQISARFHFSAEWQTITGRQIMPGPGRDEAVRRRQLAMKQAQAMNKTVAPIDLQGMRQVVGFTIAEYTDEAATIRIASASPSEGGMFGQTYSLTWSDGDWKLNLSGTGLTSVQSARLGSLTGYTPWGLNASRP
ncbi:hypothetical protein [Yinghuangia soli]|uniref:DUF8175 domain-containing protein n=1 Tax=Yinghuangia soli TaxID=2908204 RepID=A0AA41PWP8_9ACTN|nr:hypothetical protein [Yinghuangia soli]MCF2526730.1 hypothetical protein [Yinghuangia soli]